MLIGKLIINENMLEVRQNDRCLVAKTSPMNISSSDEIQLLSGDRGKSRSHVPYSKTLSLHNEGSLPVVRKAQRAGFIPRFQEGRQSFFPIAGKNLGQKRENGSERGREIAMLGPSLCAGKLYCAEGMWIIGRAKRKNGL
ncbi:MAG: hypothetical protein SF339_02930 [Blastocatellia bacterium]|nr:hypothetical protein [Blastocatellia bacterium]